MEVAGARVVVIGLGVSGSAAARLLARRGARVLGSDSAPDLMSRDEMAALEGLGIAIETGGHCPNLLDGADLVVLSPGVDPGAGPAAQALGRAMKVVSEVEVASWYFDGTVVGITGSNGKSTTTALAAEMLAAGGVRTVPGGNLGRAFSTIVDDEEDIEVVVLELSSFQLEQVDAFRAETGVMLNVTPDHLDRYPALESYEAAKARLWEGQRKEDWAIFSADDPGAARLAATAPGIKIPFTLGGRPGTYGGWIEERAGVKQAVASLPDEEKPSLLFRADDVPLPGPHNLSNALAAALVARRYGADVDAIGVGLRRFKGLEHRMELVGSVEGVSFYDDSKATNVDSARASLSSFLSDVVLIAGGKHKGTSYLPLREEVLRCCKAVVLTGEARPYLREELEGAVPIYEEESLEAAVDRAFYLARPRGVVLLAPACSSFDMFDNYKQRGRIFQGVVRDLLGDKSKENDRQ